MKTLAFSGKQVKDVGGLYYDLLKEHFEVENVGTGPDCTYVYLGDAEDKDPEPLVEAWSQKPALAPSRAAVEERRRMAIRVVETAKKEMEAKAAARAAEEARRIEHEAVASPITMFIEGPPPGPEAAAEPAQKQGILSRLFKVFRS